MDLEEDLRVILTDWGFQDFTARFKGKDSVTLLRWMRKEMPFYIHAGC